MCTKRITILGAVSGLEHVDQAVQTLRMVALCECRKDRMHCLTPFGTSCQPQRSFATSQSPSKV
jgi:hypothetical protein